MDVVQPNTLPPALHNFIGLGAVIVTLLWVMKLIRWHMSLGDLLRYPPYRIVRIPAVGHHLEALSSYSRDHLLQALMRSTADSCCAIDSIMVPLRAQLTVPSAPLRTDEMGAAIAPDEITVKLVFQSAVCVQAFWGVSEDALDDVYSHGSMGAARRRSGCERELETPVLSPGGARQRFADSHGSTAPVLISSPCALRSEMPRYYSGPEASSSSRSREVEHRLRVPTDLWVEILTSTSKASSSEESGEDNDAVSSHSGESETQFSRAVCVLQVFPARRTGTSDVLQHYTSAGVLVVVNVQLIPVPVVSEPVEEASVAPFVPPSYKLTARTVVVLPHRSLVCEDVYRGSDSASGEAESECVVCLTDPANVLLLPCRHLCACLVCFKHLTQCPVCRSPFTGHIVLAPSTTETSPVNVIPARVIA